MRRASRILAVLRTVNARKTSVRIHTYFLLLAYSSPLVHKSQMFLSNSQVHCKQDRSARVQAYLSRCSFYAALKFAESLTGNTYENQPSLLG